MEKVIAMDEQGPNEEMVAHEATVLLTSADVTQEMVAAGIEQHDKWCGRAMTGWVMEEIYLAMDAVRRGAK
jgi:hypothetical protein